MSSPAQFAQNDSVHVPPVVPNDTNLSIVILMRMFIEDVAKKRVPHTLILSSQISYILKKYLQELIGFYIKKYT